MNAELSQYFTPTWAAELLVRRHFGALTCQAIALLPGWMDSKGARLEFTVATNLGMRALHAEHITGPAEDAR
ncbi:TPA: DUF4406 domain-containing protein [Pseudomonas aeruginosa]